MAPFLLLALTAAAPQFAVLHTYSLPGDGGWDDLTIDSASHRLYISRGNRVQVMDASSGKMVGETAGTNGVHAIALNPAKSEGYISCGRDNQVLIFDTKTLKTKETVKVGENPDLILYEGTTHRVFTFNGRSQDSTVLDALTHKVIGTIKIGGKPEFAKADGKGHLWVNVEDKSEVQEIDTMRLSVVKKWPLAPGEEPTGLGFDSKKGLLFSACGNQMLVVSDAKSGKVMESAPIGHGADGAAADAGLHLAFSPNGGDGTVTIVDTSGKSCRVIQTLKTMTSARTMTYDEVHHMGYLIAAEFDAPAAGQRRGKMKANSAVIIVIGRSK